MAERFRTTWKGFLRLSLVTIPVRMVSAVQTANEVHFNQIDRTTRQRIRYQKVNQSGDVVDKDDIVRGYEVEPGQYVLLDDDELDAVKLESRHTIELTQFVEACEIDPLYFEKPYYLLPDGDVAEEGYRVIRDALRQMGKVGIGQQSIRGRENLVTIHPAGDGLLLETLRYEEEIKEADQVFADIGHGKLRADLVEMATDLIGRRSAPFQPDRYENHYTAALRDLVRQKIETGTSIDVGEGDDGPGGTVVDFMEALRRSVAREGDGPAEPAKAKARSDEDDRTPPAARTEDKSSDGSKASTSKTSKPAKGSGTPKSAGSRKTAETKPATTRSKAPAKARKAG